MIDTHNHIYAAEFDNDRTELIIKAKSLGMQQIYMPAIDSGCHAAMLELANAYPGFLLPMMGLHPCYVKENYLDELQLVEQWLTQQRFSAVGEIGLDFYWDTQFEKEQYTAFEQQMQLALDFRLPIVIHSRNAMQTTINMVKPFAKKGLTGIFHCFSGSKESAYQIIDMGFYLGIGGVVTYPKAGLAEVLSSFKLENLVLETDAPYLPPVPYRGKRNEPAYLSIIAEKLATIYQCTYQSVIETTSINAQKVFATTVNS